jgi:serine/threonine protein kinase
MVDFWSLGVLLFEMCCGWSPFYAEDTQQMYKNICFGKIRFPRGVINEDGKQFVKGLLNRNPKHRLGSQRDTEELKEHSFFKPIDWKALACKQVTPPFKPVVESDESVSNFDPEFTTANLHDNGLGVGDYLDDNDPSEEWVSRSVRERNGFAGAHTPNGPLGCDLKERATPNGSATPNGIEIRKDGGGKKAANGRIGALTAIGNGDKESSPPLTSSIQEKFRGFTYSGEDAGSVISRAIGKLREASDDDVVDDEEIPEPTTEDEVEDAEAPAGRYAKQRRRKADNGVEDDF